LKNQPGLLPDHNLLRVQLQAGLLGRRLRQGQNQGRGNQPGGQAVIVPDGFLMMGLFHKSVP
jgi:hypothetical protein